jgi:hypothetical protein
MQTVKEQIYAKLEEVETLLLEASCDGEQLAETEVFGELTRTLRQLADEVEYYVD